MRGRHFDWLDVEEEVAVRGREFGSEVK